MRAARRAALGAVLALLALLLLAPGQASAASYRVAMQGYAFAPASLTVHVGSTVTWTNGDTAPHDVKTTSGPVAIHSPMLDKGQSWTYTFTAAGSYGYYCTVHPDMTARITVLAAPKPTPTPTPTHHHETGTSHEAMPMPTRTASTTHRATSTSPKPSAPASPASPSESPSTSPPVAAAAPQTEPVAAARPLQPLLLLTGLVAGVAVLCLLLVGSRAAASRGED
ncbi:MULTISPECIES: cupredoxin family copper-binding protein [unclassified Streptomyces]|uniref:cupredoxin domain-containing protein n=1 Tax=unclassified Streptomyces TaxID=2593676 RepID=UPI00224E17ED|nr:MULTISPECIES: cupredoxin family copper-binding protein [unclassified Streptomyces]MCX5333596.1 cupredoxin family copper-binding protein [Streptomyces sp. NBC_00140]MCX5363067.1 cupredoxin family copper-binding protein [Streptomyces sp. NBC_00124]